jgi:pilus assembly protein Flp/PilA
LNVWLTISAHLRDVFDDHESGQGLAEYALILALIAIVAIVALLFLGSQISNKLSVVGNAM